VTRTLTVQSILYGNEPEAIVRAAEATANSSRIAVAEGRLTQWTLAIGDCSPEPVFAGDALAHLESVVTDAGGAFHYEVFGENLGHGGGHNRLAPSTSSDLLLILNPDAQVGPDTIGRLADTVTGDIALADGRQLPLEHPKDYDPVTGDESWASGACSMTLRSVFESVGGFDHDTFFMYCDDVDYSWRVRLAGHRVVFAPSARVFHDKRLTVDADIIPTTAEIYYSAEAAVFLAHKYSRSDIVAKIIAAFRLEPDEVYQRVVAAYEERLAAGTLPAPLDPEGRVAQFIGGNYAVHRY
jgi:GT2 family glycosyltransferase